MAVRGSLGQDRASKRERLPGWKSTPSAGAWGIVFRRFGRRAFVSAAVWASIALRVGLRLGGGRARLERRSEWRLMVAASAAERCLGLKKDEVSLV